MGSTVAHANESWGEFNVVLTLESSGASDPHDVAVVNLATLLSWATEHLR